MCECHVIFIMQLHVPVYQFCRRSISFPPMQFYQLKIPMKITILITFYTYELYVWIAQRFSCATTDQCCNGRDGKNRRKKTIHTYPAIQWQDNKFVVRYNTKASKISRRRRNEDHLS